MLLCFSFLLITTSFTPRIIFFSIVDDFNTVGEVYERNAATGSPHKTHKKHKMDAKSTHNTGGGGSQLWENSKLTKFECSAKEVSANEVTGMMNFSGKKQTKNCSFEAEVIVISANEHNTNGGCKTSSTGAKVLIKDQFGRERSYHVDGTRGNDG